MVNLLLHNNYYRYREKRKQIKIVVDTGDYPTAKTQLEAAITEYENKYSGSERRDFNYGEKLMMNHAKKHLDTVIIINDPPFVESTTGETRHQSDIVKEALLQIPKQDYSSTR